MSINRTGKKSESIQALRCIAFFCIFLFHGGLIWGNFGGFAVSVFIVLSGFLMTISYFDRDISFGIKDCILFSIKKLKVLYPLHIITMIMILFGLVIIAFKNGAMSWDYGKELLLYSALNIFLVQTFVPIININVSLNGVAWYLSVCMIVYFLFPLMLGTIRNYKSKKDAIIRLVITYLFMVALSVITANVKGPDGNFHTWITYCFPFFRALDFYIGCNLGYIYLYSNEKEKEGNNILYSLFEIACFAILPVLVWWSQKSHELLIAKAFTSTTVIFLPLSVMVVYLFAVKKGIISKLASNKLFVFLGDMSPYMFLIHFVGIYYVNSLISVLGIMLNKYIMCLLYFIFTLLGAVIYSKILTIFKSKKKMSDK